MRKLLASPLFNVSLLAIFWALQIFVAKLGLAAGARVFEFSLQTLIIVVLLLSGYVLPRKLELLQKLSPKTILFLLVIGALGAGIGGTLSNIGIQQTTATNAGFLFQFDIALTILLSWLMIKEKMNIAKIVTLLFILTGAFFLTTNGAMIIPHFGDLFILFASSFFALATVLTRKALKQTNVDPEVAAFLRTLAGLVFLSLFILFSPWYPHEVLQVENFAVNLFNLQQIIYVLLNALFCLGTIIFLNRTLKIASASYTAMISSVTPLLVAILGITFLHERLTFVQFCGALLIVSASLVTHLLQVDKH